MGGAFEGGEGAVCVGLERGGECLDIGWGLGTMSVCVGITVMLNEVEMGIFNRDWDLCWKDTFDYF